MINNLTFISGLPRSGSTLLSAILRQRPEAQAGMSSPVGPLMQALLTAMGVRSEWSPLVDDNQRRRLLRGVIDNYYGDLRKSNVVFDTNRLWCARLPLLAELFPEACVIACVRKPECILNSFERLVRGQPLLLSRMFNAEQSQNVYSRVDTLAAPDGTFGFAHRALREAFYGEHADRLVLLDYDALVRDPRTTMERLYRALDLAPFDHDFDNIAYDGGDAFDWHFGLPGLHRVEPSVHSRERRMLLPPDLVARFASQDFWSRSPSAAVKLRASLLAPRKDP